MKFKLLFLLTLFFFSIDANATIVNMFKTCGNDNTITTHNGPRRIPENFSNAFIVNYEENTDLLQFFFVVPNLSFSFEIIDDSGCTILSGVGISNEQDCFLVDVSTLMSGSFKIRIKLQDCVYEGILLIN